ncbi:MAG TPA: FadR/GntR family transcriptional regulator [Amycolatopsis sp.]|nr:FadR/GntR family transcriptional regulator [Amycolatopsis sp.]
MASTPVPNEGVPRQFERARAPKTAEIIAGSIRKQIVSGELNEGDTLPSEIELMQQFGVSRPTLREAFRILEAEALVSIRRGSRGGAQVTAPSLSVASRYVGLLLQMSGTTIGEVYEARALLEPIAASLLAARRTPDVIKQLTAVVDRMNGLKAAFENGTETDASTQAKWSGLSWRFHELVVECTGNRALAAQWGVLRDVMRTHINSQVARSWEQPEMRETLRKTVRSYARLIKLVDAGDAAGAEQHWRTHMRVSTKMLSGAQSKAIVDLFD